MNAGGPAARSPLSGGSSMTTRLLIVLGGAAILLIAAWILISILSNGSGLDTKALTSLAQQQTELARISDMPITTAVQQPTQNFAATTEMTLLTEQQVFVSYLQKYAGNKPDAPTLAGMKDSTTDTKLQTAKSDGSYDATYLSIAQTQLVAYQRSLKQAFTSAKSNSEKKLLSDAYAHSQLLVEQSQQH